MLNLSLTVRRLRLARLARLARHRAVAVAVVVVQFLVAASAVWEPRAQVRLGVHAEEQGTRHVGQHNEATCALCSVRSQASMPEAPEPPAIVLAPAATAVATSRPAPVAARRSSTLSRAPPPLPA